MPDTGFLIAESAISDPSTLSTFTPYKNTNIEGNYAYNVSVSGDGYHLKTSLPGQSYSNPIIFYGFDINLPVNTVITGIEFKIGVASDSSNAVKISKVQLTKDSSTPNRTVLGNQLNSNNINATWPSTEEIIVGGDFNLTYTDITPDIVNDYEFGFQLQFYNTSTSTRSIYIDYVSIKIYYTTSTSSSPTKNGTTASTNGSGLNWSSPSNALIKDGTTASVTCSSGVCSSYRLRVTGFNFSLPTNAKITGVTVIATVKGTTTYVRGNIQLVYNGSPIGTNKHTNYWGTTLNDKSFGSSTDTWGVNLTPQMVNSSTFGVEIQAENIATGASAYVDALRIIIHIAATALREYNISGSPEIRVNTSTGIGVEHQPPTNYLKRCVILDSQENIVGFIDEDKTEITEIMSLEGENKVIIKIPIGRGDEWK